MDSIVQKMSIDIGFGDVVTPYPMNLDYPLLLPDVPSVNLKAYSIETVIAEKFHTMLDRDVFNSRMKDFFDCYQLFVTYKIDTTACIKPSMLLSAIGNWNTMPTESCLLNLLQRMKKEI